MHLLRIFQRGVVDQERGIWICFFFNVHLDLVRSRTTVQTCWPAQVLEITKQPRFFFRGERDLYRLTSVRDLVLISSPDQASVSILNNRDLEP